MIVYPDNDYANSRLAGTIVRGPEGVPIRVNRILGRTNLVVDAVTLIGHREVSYRQEECDFTPTPLGWCYNAITNRAGYLTRRPMRNDYRQGLRSNNMVSCYGDDSRNFNEQAIARTIMGKYPSMEFCMDLSHNEQIIVPFSRDFAVYGNKILFKWFGEVGDIVEGRPRLFDRNNFLNESLELVVNG